MAYYDSEGNWVLTWGDDFNNPPAPTGNPPEGASPEVAAKIISEARGTDYNSVLNDIKTGQEKEAAFEALKTSDPNAYQHKLAQNLSDSLYSMWISNRYGSSGPIQKELEAIKETNPHAYYAAELSLLGRKMGWNHGQNTSERNAEYTKQIQSMLPEMVQAGISPEQVNKAINTNFSDASSANQMRIANEAAGGNFWTNNLIGGLKVGSLALGAYGLDTALAAGGGAASAGATSAPTAGTGAVDAYMTSAGLTPGAFEGAAFTMPSSVGSAAVYTNPADYITQSGLNTGTFNAPGFTMPGATTATELAGPTYGELGYTGVPEGGMGPTYAEMGYTGLNNAEAIAAADAAAKGMSVADVLKYANTAGKVLSTGNTLAKLLSGGKSGGTASKTSGINPMQLGNLLAGGTPQSTDYLGQYKMNQNPFFNSAQGSLGGENVYDVSGVNMANALRKR